MTEQWLPVPGTDGVYEVSDAGRVRSHHPRWRAPRLLMGEWSELGYHRAWIAGRKRFVHQLVLEAFVGPAPLGHEVRHLDGDSRNNALGNLAWGTKSENEQDRLRHGTHHQRRKTHCKHNHPYDEANTYWTTDGHRQCRACHRANQAARVRLLREWVAA